MRYALLPLFLFFTLLTACDDDDNIGTPKPRGYFRIALPEKTYVLYGEGCPFTFEIPSYAKMYHSAAPNAEPCWRDLYFTPFKATMYISYKEITNDTMLRQLINESWALTEAHRQMTTGLRDSSILRPGAHVFGSVQSLSGNAATPVQFYLTDSTKHFLRGSLYFYAEPNKDSIAPVLDYIRKDIYRMAETLKWEDVALKFETPRPYDPAKDEKGVPVVPGDGGGNPGTKEEH